MTGSSRVEHMRAKHKPGGLHQIGISYFQNFPIFDPWRFCCLFHELSDFGSIWVHVLWTAKHMRKHRKQLGA